MMDLITLCRPVFYLSSNFGTVGLLAVPSSRGSVVPFKFSSALKRGGKRMTPPVFLMSPALVFWYFMCPEED